MSPALRQLSAGALLCGSLALAAYAVTGVPPHAPSRPQPRAALSRAPITQRGEPPAPATPVAPPDTGLLAIPRSYHLPPAPPPADLGPSIDADALYARTVESLACVTIADDRGETAASGFVIDGRGHVITAAQEWGPGATAFVTLGGLGTQTASLVRADPDRGLILLRVPAAAGRPPVPLGRNGDLAAALNVHGILCSPALGLVLKPATLSPSLDPLAPADSPLLGAPFPDGSAGTPLFAPDGMLAGIILQSTTAESDNARILAAPQLRLWLAESSLAAPAFGLSAADYLRFGIGASDPVAALRAFRTALVLEPGSVDATYNLGVAAARVPEGAATAIAAYRQATRLAPTHIDAYLNLALLSIETGNLREAAALLEDIIVLQPEHVDALSTLGEVYRRLNRPTAARAMLAQALAADPAAAIAHYNLGVLLAPENPRGARDAFRAYLRAAPEAPEAALVQAFAGEQTTG